VLDGLRAALDAATAGHGALVLLSGDAGIGKTAVAAQLADQAAMSGMAVAWGRCADGDGVPAY
jgi:predicted ATPase